MTEENHELNRYKTEPKAPVQPNNNSGTLGDRNPFTGKYQVHTENGGVYEVKKIFNSSPSNTTPVQLNPTTRTVDWKNNTGDRRRQDNLIKRRPDPATADPVPDPQPEEPDKPINAGMANCFLCWLNSAAYLNPGCVPAGIYCRDGTGVRLDLINDPESPRFIYRAPIRIEYGVKLKFQTEDNTGDREFYYPGPFNVAIIEGEENIKPPNPYFGTLLYAQLATTATIGGVGTGSTYQFELYKQTNPCDITLVKVNSNGDREVVSNGLSCENLIGSYTPSPAAKDCVVATDLNGNQIFKSCDIDQFTITYECVIRVYSIRNGKKISWNQLSDGRLREEIDFPDITYTITNEPLTSSYNPGSDPAFGRLRYSEFTNKTFTVHQGINDYFSSSDARVFQIYEDFVDRCIIRIVEVVLSGSFGFSGATGSLEYNLVHESTCGAFSIELGSTPTEPTLWVFNNDGSLRLYTTDFDPDTVIKTDVSNAERPEFEIKYSAEDPPVYVQSLTCLVN